jgi:hypothetical protein
MKTWIYNMVALRRPFRAAAEQAPPRDSKRIYWDRRSRQWGGVRAHMVGRRPAC